MGTKFGNSGPEIVEPGTYLAVCISAVDLGTHTVTYPDGVKRQPKILLTWELVDELMADGRPFVVSQQFTNSSYKDAPYRKLLESWRGRAFTAEELASFDVANLIGKACLLGVTHNENKGRTYANAATASGLIKGTVAPASTHNPKRVWEMESGVVPEDMPEWIVRQIIKSEEYRAGKVRVTKMPAPRDGQPPDHVEPSLVAAGLQTPQSPPANPDADDIDLPF